MSLHELFYATLHGEDERLVARCDVPAIVKAIEDYGVYSVDALRSTLDVSLAALQLALGESAAPAFLPLVKTKLESDQTQPATPQVGAFTLLEERETAARQHEEERAPAARATTTYTIAKVFTWLEEWETAARQREEERAAAATTTYTTTELLNWLEERETAAATQREEERATAAAAATATATAAATAAATATATAAGTAASAAFSIAQLKQQLAAHGLERANRISFGGPTYATCRHVYGRS